MNEHYVQGFIQKCAEAGVDPAVLVKAAVRGDFAGRAIQALSSAGPGMESLMPKVRAEGGAQELARFLKGLLRDATWQQRVWHRAERGTVSADELAHRLTSLRRGGGGAATKADEAGRMLEMARDID